MHERVQKMWIELTADRRKAAMLGGLIIVAAGMWVRYGLQSGGPTQAAAQTPTGAVASESALALDSAFAELTRVREQLAAGVKVIRRPRYSDRDVFTLDPDHFPIPIESDLTSQEDPKSPVVFVETPEERAARERESRLRRVTQEADQLRLRSVMVGSRLAAVIEATVERQTTSHVLRPGQSVEGFVLVEVHTDRVLLEKEGVMVEMFIQAPNEQ